MYICIESLLTYLLVEEVFVSGVGAAHNRDEITKIVRDLRRRQRTCSVIIFIGRLMLLLRTLP